MEIPLVDNFGTGSYSPWGDSPDSVQQFILSKSNFFLLREGQPNESSVKRQAKWSHLSKILWAKSIDEISILILPLSYGKKASEVIYFYENGFLLCDD